MVLRSLMWHLEEPRQPPRPGDERAGVERSERSEPLSRLVELQHGGLPLPDMVCRRAAPGVGPNGSRLRSEDRDSATETAMASERTRSRRIPARRRWTRAGCRPMSPRSTHEPGVLVRMSGAGEQSTISDPTDEDITAAVIYDVDQLVRHGHVAQAAFQAGSLPPLGPDPLGPALSRLSESGYEEEAAIIGLAWRQPILLHVLGWAHRLGWIGAFVAFVAFFWPAQIFAAIPAMGARLLVSELYLQLAGRRVLESLPRGDRRRARTLFDLSIYSTRGTHRLGSVDAAMLTLGGIVLYGGALWARTTTASEWFVWAMTVSGTIMAFAGGFAVAATRRLAHSGVKTSKELKALPPPPVERPPVVAIQDPVVFPRPRFGRLMLLPVFLLIVGVPTILEGTPKLVLVGALCLAAEVPAAPSCEQGGTPTRDQSGCLDARRNLGWGCLRCRV